MTNPKDSLRSRIEKILVSCGLQPRLHRILSEPNKFSDKDTLTEATDQLLELFNSELLRVVQKAYNRRSDDLSILERPELWRNGYNCGISELTDEVIKALTKEGKE